MLDQYWLNAGSMMAEWWVNAGSVLAGYNCKLCKKTGSRESGGQGICSAYVWERGEPGKVSARMYGGFDSVSIVQ